MEGLDGSHQFSTKALYDIKLVQRAIKQDDQKAYEELMARYREPVYYMMLRMMNNNHNDAEDLTMEAFGKAFKFINQYTTTFAFSTWLFKIASNNAIDFIRHNKLIKKGTLSLDKTIDNESGDTFAVYVKTKDLNPEEQIVRKQNVDNLRNIITALKPNYREIVELFYFEELTNEEISQRVNLPLSSVKTRLFRARELILTIAKEKKLL